MQCYAPVLRKTFQWNQWFLLFCHRHGDTICSWDAGTCQGPICVWLIQTFRTIWVIYHPTQKKNHGITEVNLNHVQRVQNLLARIICNNSDYIHSGGIDLVRSLKLQTIRERREYFRCVVMFKCIHGLAPHYLSNDVTMHVDIHGYDARSAENMESYIPRCTKETYKRSFLYIGSS